MIQWKQRLYAFLLRRVLGPFLDASATRKLYDSIDVSLQEGTFVLKDVSLNAEYLSQRIAAGGSGLSIRRATVERLEIQLTLRENSGDGTETIHHGTSTAAPRSSWAWRAMKLGSTTESFPAVSLIAEIRVQGVELELEPCYRKRQRSIQAPAPMKDENAESAEPTSTSIVGSYVDAALASLQLTLKLSNINVKLCHMDTEKSKETWMSVYLSSMIYNDLDLQSGRIGSACKTVLNKSLDISEITIKAGERLVDPSEDLVNKKGQQSTVAMAQGAGRVYFRVMEYTTNKSPKNEHRNLQQDIEVNLNHQLNFSVDQLSLQQIRMVLNSFSNDLADQDNTDDFQTPQMTETPSLMQSTFLSDDDTEHEDLKAITGIMKQYREAYHLAENNQLRGGILVPSHAYIDDLGALEEDDAMTFDVFFDANDQSFYNAASVLRESVIMQDLGEDHGDSVQTKLSLHLLSGCVKINFRDPSQQHLKQSQEYILVTLDDLNVSVSSSRHRSELTVNVSHFEIEDAQLDSSSSPDDALSDNAFEQSSIDVSSWFGFVSASSDWDEYEAEVVVSQVPCITVHLQQARDLRGSKSATCDIVLLPVELTVRHRTLSNLSQFAVAVTNSDKRSQSPPKRQSSQQIPVGTGTADFSLSCACPSLSISIPLLQPVSTTSLFNRCGEKLESAPVKAPALGIILDTISLELEQGDHAGADMGVESSTKLSWVQMVIFASAPVGDKVSIDARMQRTDIALVNGRTEVDPYIPISLEIKKKHPSSQDNSLGRDTFPIVPTISSFKARQEDEDEELKIDRLLFSKLHDVESDSRKHLRGKDPQIAMITDAEKSKTVATLSIPEVIVDLTKTELQTVLEMLEAVWPKTPENSCKPPDEPVNVGATSPSQCASFALNVDQITVSLKEDFRIEDLYGDRNKRDRFSCLLALNNLKSHALFDGSSLKHFRLLVHDLGFYSALHPRIDAEVQRSERELHQRVFLIKQRIRVYKDAILSPILYRSQMFTPICQDAPSLLVDVRDLSGNPPGAIGGFTQKQIYPTLYHITLRYEADADWIERVGELLPKRRDGGSPTSAAVQNVGKQKVGKITPSMTRVFVSVADCNLDYTPPSYFEMASRSVVRLGDFRFSSNIMQPPSRFQAYSVSLGDFSYNVCDHRLSHGHEDSRLCRAPIIMPTIQLGTAKRKSSMLGTTAEALLREMGFIEVLALDSMDAVIAVSNWNIPGRKRVLLKDPAMTTSLTFGLLSVSACKDSFNCFATSIGELQAKLTALSDIDIVKIREKSKHAVHHKPDFPIVVDEQLMPSQVPPADQQRYDTNLLDGYEWTEIEHDPLRELEIPVGDEQVSGWYNTNKSSKSPTKVTTPPNPFRSFPGRTIHHHFPLHSITNPLADGDMNASKYAGEGSELTLKSRLLVHKLSVKLRFYDGYDWPEKLTDKQKQVLRKKGSFVIEPLPRAELAEAKKRLNSKVRDELEEREGEGAKQIRQKVGIMADLLKNDNEESSPFDDVPLPEEKAVTVEQEEEIRRLTRKTKLYLQVSAHGITIRIDGFEESLTHRLASVLSLSVSDLFMAETASLKQPVKMLGEWINENAHPRDTRFGTMMLKMVTWKPANHVTEDNEIESDDCEVTMQLLPMRAIIDQRAIQFSRAFFHNQTDEDETKKIWSSGLHLVPPLRFRAFRVRPWKLKVDYIPQKIDVCALREGSLVELINVSPIDGMIITLSHASVEGVVGFGDVMGGLTNSWLQEIVSTQLHKFLANARPFEPFTDVGQGFSDLVVLPYEAFKNGDDIQRAMTQGFKSLAETVTFQALTTTSRMTEYAANKMASIVGGRYHSSAANPLPARPTSAPKGVQDVTGHAMESLARGFQAANHKVVIIPYREYTRIGATGAATSVLRGIPVMLVAPVTGATEALSYTLLGARNALRPDIRREEEASRTGFTSYDI